MIQGYYFNVEPYLKLKTKEQLRADHIDGMWIANCMQILKIRDEKPNCAVFTPDCEIYINENCPIPDIVWHSYCELQKCDNYVYELKSPELILEYEMYLRRSSKYKSLINCPKDCPVRILKEVPNTDGLFRYICYFNEEINCKNDNEFPEKCVFK